MQREGLEIGIVCDDVEDAIEWKVRGGECAQV